MAYRKFDDPSLDRDNSQMKAKSGRFGNWEAFLRALQGLNNRVIGDAAATACTTAVCATAATGVATTVEVKVSINGCEYNVVASGNLNLGTGAYSGDNLELGKGTMGANCVTRFLIYGKKTGVAEVAGPGNIVDKDDYATAALAAAECKLPDLPEECVALGSLLLQGPYATGCNFSIGGAGTMGTCTFTNFYNMPYQEPFKAEA